MWILAKIGLLQGSEGMETTSSDLLTRVEDNFGLLCEMHIRKITNKAVAKMKKYGGFFNILLHLITFYSVECNILCKVNIVRFSTFAILVVKQTKQSKS